MEIVKVQVPITTTVPNGQDMCLIYARGRVNKTQQELPEMRKTLGGAVKGYFLAEFDAKKELWTLGERVEDQQW